MAIQLGSAYGKASLDVKGLRDGVAKGKESLADLEKSAKRIGESMKNVGKTLTASLTVPIGALSIQATKLASDLVESESKVKVVFGNMTDYVMDWSKGSAKSMQLSRQQALEAAATFGNLFVAMKIGQQPAAEMSTTLVQLAADLGSINNILPEVALAKLKSGIVGETEAVRDLGIDLRATVVEAKAAEMGFQKLNGQFQQGDLIAARYAIIMEQTAVAQGDIARTGGELAGQMRQLNAQWKDALTALGKNLLPVALKFITFLNQMLEKFNSMTPAQQKVIGYIILFAAAIGPLLILLGTLLTTMKLSTAALNPFSGGIVGLVFSFVKLLSALAIVVKVLSFFGVSLGPIAAGILSLNTAIAGVGTSILAALTPILIIILAIAASVIWLAVMWKTNFLGMRDNWTAGIKFMQNVWKAFTSFLRGDSESAIEYLREAWNTFVDWFNLTFQKIFGIQNAWEKFMQFMRDALGRLVSYIRDTFSRIDWSLVGKYILQGIANGMLLGIPALLQVAGKVATTVLAEIKKKLGIASPSVEAMKLGVFTAQGFQMGLQKVSPEDMARSLVKPITNQSTSTQQTIVQNFASGLTVSQARQMISENNEQLMNTMINALGGA